MAAPGPGRDGGQGRPERRHEEKIACKAVTATEIFQDATGGVELSSATSDANDNARAVGSNRIRNQAVGTMKINSEAVTTVEIA